MNIFCGLHFLIGIAEQAEAALYGWEKAVFGEDREGAKALLGSFERAKSRTVGLVHTACKAFQEHRNEQAGFPIEFLIF